MKQSFFFTMLLSAVLINKASAQDAPVFTKDGVVVPTTDPHPARLSEINKADSIFDFGMAAATFPAGTKLDWHMHPGGQILIITDGVGYYQEEGKPRQVVRKGAIIKCLPGVEHWHGASKETGVTYIAANPAQNGPTVWFGKVSDEQYNGTSISSDDNKGYGNQGKSDGALNSNDYKGNGATGNGGVTVVSGNRRVVRAARLQGDFTQSATLVVRVKVAPDGTGTFVNVVSGMNQMQYTSVIQKRLASRDIQFSSGEEESFVNIQVVFKVN